MKKILSAVLIASIFAVGCSSQTDDGKTGSFAGNGTAPTQQTQSESSNGLWYLLGGMWLGNMLSGNHSQPAQPSVTNNYTTVNPAPATVQKSSSFFGGSSSSTNTLSTSTGRPAASPAPSTSFSTGRPASAPSPSVASSPRPSSSSSSSSSFSSGRPSSSSSSSFSSSSRSSSSSFSSGRR